MNRTGKRPSARDHHGYESESEDSEPHNSTPSRFREEKTATKSPVTPTLIEAIVSSIEERTDVLEQLEMSSRNKATPLIGVDQTVQSIEERIDVLELEEMSSRNKARHLL